MRTTKVIQHINGVWQDVSPFWGDAISQRFKVSVVTEMEGALQNLDRACTDLEQKTDTVNEQLRNYENV